MRSATVVLPVPGLPVKHMCSVGVCAVQARFSAQLVDHQQRGDVADAGFHRRQADSQIAVEFVGYRSSTCGVGQHFAPPVLAKVRSRLRVTAPFATEALMRLSSYRTESVCSIALAHARSRIAEAMRSVALPSGLSVA